MARNFSDINDLISQIQTISDLCPSFQMLLNCVKYSLIQHQEPNLVVDDITQIRDKFLRMSKLADLSLEWIKNSGDLKVVKVKLEQVVKEELAIRSNMFEYLFLDICRNKYKIVRNENDPFTRLPFDVSEIVNKESNDQHFYITTYHYTFPGFKWFKVSVKSDHFVCSCFGLGFEYGFHYVDKLFRYLENYKTYMDIGMVNIDQKRLMEPCPAPMIADYSFVTDTYENDFRDSDD